ncbi:MAG: DUF2867 domain-containing protein [Pseudomonadota bacterium]
MTRNFAKPDRTPDFEDCFTGPNAFPDRSAYDLAKMVVGNAPLWFRILFAVRQRIARLFGLVTKSDDGKNPGASFLLTLPVVENSPNRYEADISDKHLDFTLCLEKENEKINLRTQIWFNNIFGRAYLFVVKPFHNKIVSHWVSVLGRPA